QKKEMYENYLLQKRKEIYRQWSREDDAYRYNYPELSQIEEMVKRYDSRIYERSSMDDDFLTFSVGHYRTHPAFTVEDSAKELETEKNPFREEVKEMKQRYGTIDKPQVVDLKNSHIGLVGEKSVIHEQLKNYIAQIAFAQSYHEVQFIAVYEECYEEHFAWMRWLSHTKLRGLNVLGLIHSEKTRDQVLGSMQQIIKERKQKLEEEKKEARFLPHYVFIIDEPKMLMDHSIMEFLGSKDGDKLGFSIIYTSNQQANLPENIGTVVLLENSTDGRLLLQEKELCNQKLNLYRLGEVDLEWLARNLGVLVHEQGMTSHIPESITFFDMYGIQKPEELQIQGRWSRNNSSKTLAVPLGARAADDCLELNLHEKAHGPHGLVAGTTGSGKSEIVQSYILSLAVNFHPNEVGFLLIDYKGGGMANLFKNLPHLLGTITNLDGSESMRALASIQAELRRRQKVFGEYDVNHINAYNDLFKEGTAKEPIPHLFIISDEFAELKKEQPEFMKELVSTARIGRSLGVHLILATQKPTGVVDDQIWTNSKFKLCLKVQNEADSKEVLHTPDAANITQAGRAYLQVGNNEIYELFQSAWSGATYIKETEKEVTQDNRIYLVNELGQGELINQDLRGTKAEQKAKETQLDVVVNYIHDVYEHEHSVDVAKPWLPSLAEKLVNPHVEIIKKEKVDLDVVAGMVDIPEEQEQKEYTINLAKQGNIVYVASSGYGKSVFLANAMMNLACKNRVSNLNFYVLDFGNNALINMSNLPHTADYIMLDDEEKFQKFRDLMLSEVQLRKKKLASAMVQNFAVYNETAEVPMKAIVILIDNYDAIKEMGYDMENYFTRLSRDGAGLGIYMIITASRMSAIRAATMNNFRNKIGGVNFDENEVKTLIGRSSYALPEVRGRALIKIGEIISIMQLFTPVDFENEVEYSRNLKEYVARVKESYPNEEAPHIPILPEEITYESFERYQGKEGEIAIGLDRDTVERKGYQGTNMPFLILGDNGSGKTNVLRLILNQLKAETTIYLIDSRNRGLYEYQKQVHYLAGKEAVEDFTNELQKEARKRSAMLDVAIAEGKNPQTVLAEMEPYYVMIDDIDDFCNQAEGNLNIVAGRFEQAAAQGIRFIVTANTNKFKGTDNFTKFMKGTRNGVLLSEQGYLTIFPVKSTEKFVKPDGLLMIDGKGSYVRIPKVI
ncbi:MAG: type VII secretion protein EssC, partial [Lachnospiraceae bacterium]|nr:type VII secretion protein EssC [Lachnospiraceae bacterium]